jgi:hypothetical protein
LWYPREQRSCNRDNTRQCRSQDGGGGGRYRGVYIEKNRGSQNRRTTLADANPPRQTRNAPMCGTIRPELTENGPKWSAIQNRRNSTFFPLCAKTFGYFAVIVRGVEISAELTSIEREWRKIYTADFEYSEGKLRRFYLCRFGTLVNSGIICKWTHVWRGLLQRLDMRSLYTLDRR